MGQINGKKIILIIILSLLMSVIFECLAKITAPPIYHYQMSDNINSVITQDMLEYKGYKNEGGNFIPIEPDPQMFVPVDLKTRIASVRISFADMIKEPIKIQIFYPDENGYYSEADSRIANSLKNVDDIVFNIPFNKYNQIRIDIDGEFKLAKIETSAESAIKIPCPEAAFNYLRMLAMFLIFGFIIFLLFYYHVLKRIKKVVVALKDSIKKNRRKITKGILLTGCITVGLCLILYIALCLLSKKLLLVYFVFTALFGFIVSIFILFFKQVGKKAEYFFLLIFLSSALLFAFFTPTTVALQVWDDETHFSNMIELSNFGEENSKYTEADIAFIQRQYPQTFSVEEQNAIYENMNEQNEEWAQVTYSSSFVKYCYRAYQGYLPGAVAIFFGRLFKLPYQYIIILARTAILCVFAALSFFAIRRLKTGKMILALISLLPTNVYLASHLSYDTWVTGFLLLGFAWYFSEIQQPEKPLSVRDWIIMITAMVIGLGPKAIYFPMLALFFFMPKQKFISKRRCTTYRLSILFAMLIAMITVAIPVLVKGGEAYGDLRGGGNVSASGQIIYILQNPISYAKTLFNFLIQYLSVSNAQMYTSSLAYIGNGFFFGILVILLAVVAFTDKDQPNRLAIAAPQKIMTLTISLITVILIATALYVSFTPVGLNTINGCQARYILPILFPVLYVIGTDKIVNRMNKSTYNTIIFLISGSVLFINIGYFLVYAYYLAN